MMDDDTAQIGDMAAEVKLTVAIEDIQAVEDHGEQWSDVVRYGGIREPQLRQW